MIRVERVYFYTSELAIEVSLARVESIASGDFSRTCYFSQHLTNPYTSWLIVHNADAQPPALPAKSGPRAAGAATEVQSLAGVVTAEAQNRGRTPKGKEFRKHVQVAEEQKQIHAKLVAVTGGVCLCVLCAPIRILEDKEMRMRLLQVVDREECAMLVTAILLRIGARQTPINASDYMIIIASGMPEFKRALAEIDSPLQSRSIELESEICVTSGATEGLLNTVMAFVEPGDEVIILEPVFSAYVIHIEPAGWIPRYVPMHPPAGTKNKKPMGNNWTLDLKEVEATMTPKIKILPRLHRRSSWRLKEANRIGWWETNRVEIKGKIDSFCEVLDELEIPYVYPSGACFVFVNTAGIKSSSNYKFPPDIASESRDMRLTWFLIHEIDVASIPGSTFYGPDTSFTGENYLRFGLCKSGEGLELAKSRSRKLKPILKEIESGVRDYLKV
ncbi:hypothetical protein B7494_g6875 [Chlorociboria aeruginascens]|nr:hypothetical protein B7494_g6875 [Chlorociboria aeruginascens]